MKLDETPQDQRLSLDVTPLIDVVFILLLFFAVSTSFISGTDLSALKSDVIELGDAKVRLSEENATLNLAQLRQNILEAAAATDKAHWFIKTLESQKVDLQGTLDSSELKNSALESQLEKAYADFRALDIKLTGLQSEIDKNSETERLLRVLLLEREAENTSAGKTITSLERERSLLFEQNASGKRERELLAEQKLEIEREHASLSEQNAAGERERELLARQKLEAEREHALLSERNASGERERELLSRQKLKAESERGSLAKLLASRTAGLEQAEQAADAQRNKERLLQLLLAERAAKLSDLEVQLVKAGERNQSLSGELNTARCGRRGPSQLADRNLKLRNELTQYREVAALGQEQIEKILAAQKSLEAGLKSDLAADRLGIKREKQRLVLQLSNRILFDSGSAAIKPAGSEVLRKVGEIIQDTHRTLDIQIGGHTDNVPMGAASDSARRAGLTGNWGLSAARAVNVVTFLDQRVGIDSERLSAVGYGEHGPVSSNATADGRSLNRRIEIVLVPN